MVGLLTLTLTPAPTLTRWDSLLGSEEEEDVRWSVADTAAGVPVRATASYLSAVFDAQAEAFDDDLHAPCTYHAHTMHIPCMPRVYHACACTTGGGLRR